MEKHTSHLPNRYNILVGNNTFISIRQAAKHIGCSYTHLTNLINNCESDNFVYNKFTVKFNKV